MSFDEIIPVPLHKKRFRERGYNQLTTFGHSLSKQLNIPYNESILHRDVYAVTQTKKSFFDRTENKKTTFIGSGKFQKGNKTTEEKKSGVYIENSKEKTNSKP